MHVETTAKNWMPAHAVHKDNYYKIQNQENSFEKYGSKKIRHLNSTNQVIHYFDFSLSEIALLLYIS